MTAFLKKRLIMLALFSLSALIISSLAIWHFDRRAAAAKQEKSIHQLNLGLEHLLTVRFANTAAALAGSAPVVQLLSGELADSSRDVILTLETARSVTGADLVFILDRQGVLISSSTHAQKSNIINKSYAFRPYFKAGIGGRSSLYTAVGAYTRERGVYFSAPVYSRSGRDTIGVAVFKAGFEGVDRLFAAQDDILLLFSPDGVVMATNREGWLYRTARQLDSDVQRRISAERQFPEDFELKPLEVGLDRGVRVVRLDDGSTCLVHGEETALPGWRLVSLEKYTPPLAWMFANICAVLLISALALLYIVSQDRKIKLQQSYEQQSIDLNRTRRELEKSESLLSSVVEDQSEMICRFDEQRQISFVNGAFCRYFNKERAGLIGSSFVPPFSEGELEKVTKHFRELTPDNPVGEIEYSIVLPEHGQRWHAATIRKIFPGEGDICEYQVVLRDITARKQSEETLVEANEELSQYAYAVSHDLKAPLRAIHNYNDFLREDLTGRVEPEQLLYLERMNRAVSEAESMIEDLLSLATVSQRRISFDEIDTGPLLDGVVAVLNLSADVRVQKPDSWPVIETEPVLLRQIFMNLIGNAVKYNNSAEKLVELGWSDCGNGNCQFFVRDNGIGIDKRYHEQIFRVFERLHTRDEYEGTGAGLAIVRKAVSRLNGTIRVESEPGSGSTFFVVLPFVHRERMT